MKKSNLSLRQRLEKANGSQEIENLRANHAWLHGRNQSTEEWGFLWSRNNEASWAHTFGRVRGFDAVWYVGVSSYDAKAARNYLQILEKRPDLGGIDMRCLMMIAFHTLTTDVIEVADDCKSARAFYLTAGVSFNNIDCRDPDSPPSAGQGNERYGADFVCENGKWLFLHEHICMDANGGWSSGNWARQQYEVLADPSKDPMAMMMKMEKEGGPGGPPPSGPGLGFPEMMDPGPLHNDYSALQPSQDTVPLPKPYSALDPDNTYTSFRDFEAFKASL